MSGAPGNAANVASRLGLKAGDVVGEIGYDDDSDDRFREQIEELVGGELHDEDTDDVLDVVLLWWREDDGDLTDALVDAITLLAEDGVIWLLTPRTGYDGYVDPSEIADAARTAGLAQTTSAPPVDDWMLAKLGRARFSGRQRG